MTSANEPPQNWHVAAKSTELGADPLGVRIAGTKLVLFREKTGSIAALADLCPHQDLPLSTGWVVDGAVECLHHGLRFDGSGKCVHMPAQGEPHTRTFQDRHLPSEGGERPNPRLHSNSRMIGARRTSLTSLFSWRCVLRYPSQSRPHTKSRVAGG